VKRGVKLILDVESFDYAYFPRGARGFKVAMSDGRDKAVINQEGYYVAPGRSRDRCFDSLNIFAEKFSNNIGVFYSDNCQILAKI
jgi:hypothetical protein